MTRTLLYSDGLKILSREALEAEAAGLHDLLEGVEATLDALLNGIDNYRTTEIPGTGISADLRELVDAANESRNNVRRAAR